MKSEILYLQLKSHRMFNNLSKDDIYHILDEITLKRKKKGEHFTHNYDQRLIYFVLKGKVKILGLNAEGHEITKRIVKDGDFFGNLAEVQPHEGHYATVITDEFVYFAMGASQFEQMSLEIPQLSINLSKEMARKLRVMEERYASLVTDDVQTRLIDFFSEWADEEGEKVGREVELKNYLTHNDIAHLISTCRQTVTSILNRLKTKGNILYSRSKIVIPNIEQLREIS